MSVFERVGQLLQERVEDLLKGDDPERLFDQAILEMQKELSHARIRLTEAEAVARARKDMVEARKQEADHFQERAKKAELEGLSESAKEAAQFHRKALSNVQSLESEKVKAEQSALELRTAVEGLEKTIEDARLKRTEVSARLKEVRQHAGPRIHEGRPRPASTTGEDPFARAEQRTQQKEAQARGGRAPDLETEFRNVEREAGVDEKLEALKRKMRESK